MTWKILFEIQILAPFDKAAKGCSKSGRMADFVRSSEMNGSPKVSLLTLMTLVFHYVYYSIPDCLRKRIIVTFLYAAGA